LRLEANQEGRVKLVIAAEPGRLRDALQALLNSFVALADTVVAAQNFTGPDVLVMILVGALLTLVILLALIGFVVYMIWNNLRELWQAV
jgi:hypothetical protein